MSTSTRVILEKKVRVSSNYLYVELGGSTSILPPILEYYSSIMLGTRTRLQIPARANWLPMWPPSVIF